MWIGVADGNQERGESQEAGRLNVCSPVSWGNGGTYA